MADKKGSDFVIKDKRRLDDEGEPLPEQGSGPEEAPGQDSEGAREEAGPGPQEEPAGQAPPLPELNFATLIFSLSSSALVHLGQAPDPATGEARPDYPLAKQTIDLLGLLQDKTKGNLDEDEEKLLEGVLYDLRMAYVQVVKGGS